MKQKKNQKQSLSKGDYGYFEKNKRTQLIIAFVLLFFVALVFYTGYLRYGTTKNIFTIMAVVSVIPMAKFMVAYLVLIPYHGLPEKMYTQLQEQLETGENLMTAYDLVISSSDKIYGINVVAVRDNSVWMFTVKNNYTSGEVENYIRGFLEKECKVAAVKLFCDFQKYQSAVKALSNQKRGSYDQKIRELMLLYSM